MKKTYPVSILNDEMYYSHLLTWSHPLNEGLQVNLPILLKRVSNVLHQPKLDDELVMDPVFAPFLEDYLVENPIVFGTVLTRNHHPYSLPKKYLLI